MDLLQEYLRTQSAGTWSELARLLDPMLRREEFETVLQVFESAIETAPEDPLPHFKAAQVCEAWSDALAGDYFQQHPGHSMSPWKWMFGRGTPYPKFKELRERSIVYYHKTLELHPDLDAETREAIEEKIFWFGWA